MPRPPALPGVGAGHPGALRRLGWLLRARAQADTGRQAQGLVSPAGSSAGQRLAWLGSGRPVPPVPAAADGPVVRAGHLLFTAGQLPLRDGVLLATGKVGGVVDRETAIACARQCAINVLTQVRAELGSLDAVA